MLASRPRGKEKPIVRYLIIALGLVSVGMGVLGIFLPILPTTPFFLLAAYLFLRSSPRLYRWLLTHRIFGNYIRNYIQHRAISAGVKIFTLILLWATILLSAYLITGLLWVQVLLIGVAVGVTTHILSLRTMRGDRINSGGDVKSG